MVVVSSTAGVEPDTERHFEMLEEDGRARFLAINGMDKEQADFAKVLAALRESLSDRVVPALPSRSAPVPTSAASSTCSAGKALLFEGKDVTEGPVPADLQAMVGGRPGQAGRAGGGER